MRETKLDATWFIGMVLMILLLVAMAAWFSVGGILTRKGRECYRHIFFDE